jgi:hypothetical protein
VKLPAPTLPTRSWRRRSRALRPSLDGEQNSIYVGCSLPPADGGDLVPTFTSRPLTGSSSSNYWLYDLPEENYLLDY